MLRLMVLTLVLLNGVYFAWSHNYLRPYGFAPAPLAEPYRLEQQIRPELVRILSADEARPAELTLQTVAKPAECLQAGLFDDAEAAVLRQKAQSLLPPGSWSLDAATEPARWIVYMGKYPDAAALTKKRSELASLNLRFESLTNPALDYGLSLGGYETEARARLELAALSQRGVHTASVVQERPAQRGVVFRVPVADEAMKSRLAELRGVLVGKVLRPCK